MSKSSATRGLYTPRTSRRYSPRLDPDTIGQFTESIARFFGTGRYLLIQSVIVVVWIAINLVAAEARFDPYPFILLNLAFSTQAAYAAPLILLAQNRQENRDRVALDQDRHRAAQTKADTEYLARELASLRLAVGELSIEAVGNRRTELAGIIDNHDPRSLRGRVAHQENDQQNRAHPEHRHDDRANDDALRPDAREIFALDDQQNFTHESSYQ